jgi:hypothetical protein
MAGWPLMTEMFCDTQRKMTLKTCHFWSESKHPDPKIMMARSCWPSGNPIFPQKKSMIFGIKPMGGATYARASVGVLRNEASLVGMLTT